MADLTLVVMAAGSSSRFGRLKQVEPIGPQGETIAEYSIYEAIKGGFTKLVCVIRREIAKEIQDSLGKRLDGRIQVDYVYQEEKGELDRAFGLAKREKPLGTAHAVLKAGNVIDGPFAVMNADDVYGRPSISAIASRLSNDAERNDSEHFIAGFILANTLPECGGVSRAICHTDELGRLISVEEYREIRHEKGVIVGYDLSGREMIFAGTEIVSMNLWGFMPPILHHFEDRFREFLITCQNDSEAEYGIPTVVNALVREDKIVVKVLPVNEVCIGGLTSANHYTALVEGILRLTETNHYPSPLWLPL